MKQQHLLRPTLFLVALFAAALCSGQAAKPGGAKPEAMIQIASTISSAANDQAVLEALNESNQRLYQTVRRKFANATDISLYPAKTTTVVYCKVEGIQNNILLTNRGTWLHTVRYYTAPQLPNQVRQMVEEAFPDYELTNVAEVTAKSGTAYLVNIESRKHFKTIRVHKDQLEVYQEFIRN